MAGRAAIQTVAEDETVADEGRWVGDRLRRLREESGLDLGDVATRTRIPLRHLEAIERSDYAALPSMTYAIGFVRFAEEAAAESYLEFSGFSRQGLIDQLVFEGYTQEQATYGVDQTGL